MSYGDSGIRHGWASFLLRNTVQLIPERSEGDCFAEAGISGDVWPRYVMGRFQRLGSNVFIEIPTEESRLLGCCTKFSLRYGGRDACNKPIKESLCFMIFDLGLRSLFRMSRQPRSLQSRCLCLHSHTSLLRLWHRLYKRISYLALRIQTPTSAKKALSSYIGWRSFIQRPFALLGQRLRTSSWMIVRIRA